MRLNTTNSKEIYLTCYKHMLMCCTLREISDLIAVGLGMGYNILQTWENCFDKIAQFPLLFWMARYVLKEMFFPVWNINCKWITCSFECYVYKWKCCPYRQIFMRVWTHLACWNSNGCDCCFLCSVFWSCFQYVTM